MTQPAQATGFAAQFNEVRRFHRPVKLFLLATILDGIIYSGWGLFFNFYILERGFSKDFLGLVNAVPGMASLLLGLPIGMLSDRMGRKRAMVLGVGVSILAMSLQVLMGEANWILSMAFVSGAAGMLYYISQAPFMMQVSNPENRALLFSLNFGLVPLAGVVGNLLAGQLPAFYGSWLGVPARSAATYGAVLLTSALMSTLTLAVLMMLPGTRGAPSPANPSEPTRSGGKSFLRVLANKRTLRLAFPNLCVGLGAAILIPYMNVFLVERYGISDQWLGTLFSLSALLTGIGSIIGPRLALGLGSKIKTVVVTQAASLVFLLVVGFSPFLWLAAIGFLLRGVLMNMAIPLYSAFVMEQVAESDQGMINSIKEIAWQVGWAVGPYLSGVVQQRYGFTPLFLATAVMYTFSIGATWFFFHSAEGDNLASETSDFPV